MRLLFSTLSIACLFASGCVVPFPHSRVHDLGVSGRIVDAETGVAVANATVESVSDEQTGNKVSYDKSDADGQFHVKPTSRMHGGRAYLTVNISIWPTFNVPAPMRELTISAPGYQSSKVLVNARNAVRGNVKQTIVSATLSPGDDTLRDCAVQVVRMPESSTSP